MARIGDSINPSLGLIDYRPQMAATANMYESLGNSMAQGVGAIADVVKDRREKSDQVKVAKEKIKSIKTLFGDQAGAYLDPISAFLDSPDATLSSQAQAAGEVNNLIAAGIDKFNTDADRTLQRDAMSQADRHFNLSMQDENYDAQTKQNFANETALSGAVTRFIAAKDAEKSYKGKLPDLSATDAMIDSLIKQGQGPAAESLVKAREDQVAKFLANNKPGNGWTLTKDIPVENGFLTAWVNDETGEVKDMYGNTVAQGVFAEDPESVLPARPADDAPTRAGDFLPPLPGDPPPDTTSGQRVIPRPAIGFKPAAPADIRTPEQVRLDELKIRKLEGDISKQETDVAIAQRAESAAKTKASEALASLREIRNHPGRWAATGKTSYIPSIKGSPAYEFEQKLEKAKALAGTIGIEAMRGLGAMSEKEFEAAKASIAQLAIGQQTETIEKELDSLIRLFESKMGADGRPESQQKSAADKLREQRAKLQGQ